MNCFTVINTTSCAAGVGLRPPADEGTPQQQHPAGGGYQQGRRDGPAEVDGKSFSDCGKGNPLYLSRRQCRDVMAVSLQTLLDEGSDPLVRDKKGNSVFSVCAKAKQLYCMNMMYEHIRCDYIRVLTLFGIHFSVY